MKIGVGSKNKTKVDAVAEVIKRYPMFEGAEVIPVDVKIDQFGHPKSLEETVAGAVDRAKQAYEGNDYGFGIEGGLMAFPQTKSGYMEISVCAIFDRRQIHLGFSPGYEWPKRVVDLILNKGLDGSQALKEIGFTDLEKIGEHGGFLEVATRGRMTRTDKNKLAVMMALIHLENPEHY